MTTKQIHNYYIFIQKQKSITVAYECDIKSQSLRLNSINSITVAYECDNELRLTAFIVYEGFLTKSPEVKHTHTNRYSAFIFYEVSGI